MTDFPIRPIASDSQVPVWHFDEQRARFAWDAHSQLLRAMIANPSLRDNPVWTMLRQEAYAMLCEAYGSVFE